MELFFLCGLLLFVSFSLFSLYSYACKANQNLPVGRTGLPFIGESFEFLSAGRKGHPEKFIFDRLAKYSSRVFKTSILGESTIIVCGAAANKFLFSNENKLVTQWWPRSVHKIFITTSREVTSNEEAKRLRKILPNFIKPEPLQRYIPEMDIIAQKHFEAEWEGRKEVTVFELAKNYTFQVACKVFLSVEDPKQVAKLADPFHEVATGLVSIPIDLPGTKFRRGIKASNLVKKQIIAIIKQRKIELAEKKASPMQDILTHMLVTCDTNGIYMTEMEIANKILGLLVGGHDTTSSVITFVAKYLAELPKVYQKVLEEQMEIAKSKAPGELLNWVDLQKMKYSWNVACEAMRLAPPVQGAFREALHEFTFDGFTIPKGWKLYWSTHSTHRNPEHFPEPEMFDPTRFEGSGPAPHTYVPFGGGPRMCPGKEYSRLKILVFMYNLVKRYNWEKLIPDEKVIVDPLPMPEKGLPIRLLPRQTA